MARAEKKYPYRVIESFAGVGRVGVPNKIVPMTKSEAKSLLKAGLIREADTSETVEAERAEALKGLEVMGGGMPGMGGMGM